MPLWGYCKNENPLSNEPQAPEIIRCPPRLILDDLTECANRQRLALAMDMECDATAVVVLEKSGCAFLSRQEETVSLKRRHNAPHR